jgi:hypothetical protein
MLIEKLPFILVNTLLLHIPLLALTDTQTEWQTEEQTLSLRMGWRNFFSSCAVVSVFGSGKKQFLMILTYFEYNTVVALC